MELKPAKAYTDDDIVRILTDNLNLALRNAQLSDELDRLTNVLEDLAGRLGQQVTS